MYVRIHVYVHEDIHECASVCLCNCVYVFLSAGVPVCSCARNDVCLCKSVRVCLFVNGLVYVENIIHGCNDQFNL